MLEIEKADKIASGHLGVRAQAPTTGGTRQPCSCSRLLMAFMLSFSVLEMIS
jgi:hypothetical protein